LRTPAERRASADRRQSVERRRSSDGRDAVIEVCRSTLHLALVAHGSGAEPDRVVTRSYPWRKKSKSLFSDVGAQELTQAIRTLVTEERLVGARVRIALSGEFCVTRVVTGSTDEVRRESAEVEERSHRYLTLGPGRKVVAHSVQQLDARHVHALLTVANQRTLDALLAIADSVGIEIATIEPSLVALSRAQAWLRDGCQDACLVIQLDDSGAELGICHGGRLLLDYRPTGRTNAANVANVLALHLTRLHRYMNRHHSYVQAPIRQVYLAGDVAAVAQAQQQFARFKQFHVSVLEPSELDTNWQFANEAPGPELAAAVGTALIDEQLDDDRRNPNLVERILAESREPLRPILIRSLLPVAAMFLVAAGLFTLFMRERWTTNSVRAQLEELAPVRNRARDLQLKLLATETKLTELAKLQSRLPKPNWVQLLTRIAQSMPSDVWLDGIEVQDARSAALTGASYAEGGVYDFVNYLKQDPDVAQVALEGTGVGHSPTGPTASFDVQLSLAHQPGGNDQGDRHD
jgi:hypothetical protein